MGEAGQPTQIDVLSELRRQGHVTGFVLVEVKLTEAEFGSCRGWNGKKKNGEWENPKQSRCKNVSQVLSSPLTECWLAEAEKRQYWHLLVSEGSTLLLPQIRREVACPFRHGLYQLMRSRLLADELCRRNSGAWAEVMVCRHSANTKVTDLAEPIAGSRNALAAFRALFGPKSVREWDPEQVCQVITSLAETPVGWPKWMNGRYFPKDLHQVS